MCPFEADALFYHTFLRVVEQPVSFDSDAFLSLTTCDCRTRGLRT